MIIAKYNIAQGSGSNATVGSTAVAGGSGSGYSVDLTPITEKMAALEAEVSQLRNQLNKVNAAMAALDGKYLSKYGDRSEYTYALGAVYTEFLQSELYDNGVGYRISGNPTATVEDKYNLIVKDVGWGYAPWTTVRDSTVTVVDTATDEATAQLNAVSVSIGATNAAGFMLLDCGAQLTNERCFTLISKSVQYSVKVRRDGQQYLTEFVEAETDSNGNFILYFDKGENVSFTVRFKYTYSFKKIGTFTSGTYRLYIRGTDPSNSRTDCFAATTKTTTVNASGVTVMQGTDGARITSGGVQVTNDGGTTWTSIGGSSASFGNNHDLSL